MRKILTTALALALTLSVQAQTKDSIDVAQFAVVYDYKVQSTDSESRPTTDSMQLATLVGSRVTLWMEYNRAMMEVFGDSGERQYQYGEWNARQFNLPVLYMNYPEGEMRSFDKIVPHRYLVTAPLPAIDWRLDDDTLHIGGYLCHKATGKYGGRTWTVWYTEEIPSSSGPWKLRGLPGMILEANDEQGIFSFNFCGLINRQAKIAYMSEEKHQSIEERKFVSHRNKILCNKRYVHNPRYYIPEGTLELEDAVEMWPSGPEPPAEEKLTLIARDLIVPKKANAYQPLELE